MSHMIFFLVYLLLLLYLFFCFRGALSGRRGTFLAAGVIGLFLFGFWRRELFVGAVLNAFLIVFFCESLLAFLAWDLLYGICRLIFRGKDLKKFRLYGNRAALSVGVLVTVVFFLVGIPANRDYRIRNAVVRIPASAKPFSAVFFSDLHIDPLFEKGKLLRLAADLDSLAPDFVLFGGDLADESDGKLREEGYDALFQKVASAAKVQAFGITGNHEAYMESSGSDPEGWMRRNGMTVLDDSTVCTVFACFSGRVDFQVARARGTLRTPLSELRPDSVLPWILMDHQPKGMDSDYVGRMPQLGLSGHTHDGQFFPATAMIGFFWPLSVGFGSLGGIPWLVSSGIDSWGPPVRVGSETDIWHIRFEPSP